MSFSQTSWSISSKHLTVKPDSLPERGDTLQPGRHRTARFAEPHQLHAVVVGMARRLDRGAEAPDHADDHAVSTQDAGDLRRAAEAVLDGQYRRLGPKQGACAARRGLHLRCLGRNDDEVAGADGRRIAGGADGDGAIAARAFEPEPIGGDGVHVRLPGVDGPDLVAGIGHERRVDAAHGAGADDSDLHGRVLRWFRFGGSERADARAVLFARGLGKGHEGLGHVVRCGQLAGILAGIGAAA